MKTRVPNWAAHAVEELRAGREVQVRPRGHSMQGQINDGDLITLEPIQASKLQADDIVLARVRGRRYFHLVLHQVLECEAEQLLIGSRNGRIDGWIHVNDVLGRMMTIDDSTG